MALSIQTSALLANISHAKENYELVIFGYSASHSEPESGVSQFLTAPAPAPLSGKVGLLRGDFRSASLRESTRNPRVCH